MQDKVISGEGVGPISPLRPDQKGQKTSDEKFQDISDYLWSSRQSSILRETLLHLEILSEQSEPSAKPLDFLPKDKAAQNVYTKTAVANELYPTFQQFLQKGDFDSFLQVLKPFVNQSELPRGTDDSFNTLLLPFLNSRPQATGPTIGEMALKNLAGNDKQTLTKLANQDPASPLTEAAQSLLENPDVSTNLDPKDFSDIFNLNRANLRAIPIKLQSATTVPSIYQSYKEEIKDQHITETTKQSLLPLIKGQMSYLEQAIEFLQNILGNTEEVQNLAKQLAAISTPPKPEDRSAIKNLSQAIFETYESSRNSGNITPEQHQQFLSMTAKSLNLIGQETVNQGKLANNAANQLQSQVNQLDEVDDQIDQVEAFLKKGGDPEKFASTISDLALSYRNQDNVVQKRIDDLFNEVAKLKTSDGEDFSKVSAASFLNSLVEQYRAAKADNPQMMPLKDWLNSQNLPKMNNEFIKNLLTEVQILINSPDFPKPKSKKIVSFEDSAVQPSLVKATALQNSLDETTDQKQAQVEGTKGAVKNLTSFKKSVDTAAQVVETKQAIALDEPNPLDFSGYDIVKVLDKLNKMMDAEMKNVAFDLSNANAVRTSLTNLMSFLVNFPNANAAYGLGQWLTGQTIQTDPSNPANTLYNTTASMIVARCKQEITTAQAADQDIQSMISPVNKLIGFLNSLKATMGKKFPDSLQKTLDDMNTIKNSLGALHEYLSSDQLQGNLQFILSQANAYATAHPGDSKVSISTQRVSWLNYDENVIVNGRKTVTNSQGFIGLQNLHDMVQNDSQNLAMLSQSEQMDVQLNFTEMSQYWQAITQLVSKLHDIFNAPIQALKTS